METIKKNPKVSVCVVTYNQEKYIRQCLQSIVEQVTDFDFEVIVGDDFSTDGTRAIVQEFVTNYPNTVKQILHAENIGATNNYISVHNSASGTYIAHMDGDDYALPGKLQSQATHLDENRTCMIVWHRMKILDNKSSKLVDDLIDVDCLPRNGFNRNDLLLIGSIACHSSKMYRSSISVSYPNGEFLDYFVNIEQLSKGYGQYINAFHGVYRANIGVMQQTDNIKRLLIGHLLFFKKKYPECHRSISGHIFRIFLGDLKSRRKTLPLSFFAVIKTFHPLSIVYLIKSIKILKMFRSPLQ